MVWGVPRIVWGSFGVPTLVWDSFVVWWTCFGRSCGGPRILWGRFGVLGMLCSPGQGLGGVLGLRWSLRGVLEFRGFPVPQGGGGRGGGGAGGQPAADARCSGPRPASPPAGPPPSSAPPAAAVPPPPAPAPGPAAAAAPRSALPALRGHRVTRGDTASPGEGGGKHTTAWGCAGPPPPTRTPPGHLWELYRPSRTHIGAPGLPLWDPEGSRGIPGIPRSPRAPRGVHSHGIH